MKSELQELMKLLGQHLNLYGKLAEILALEQSALLELDLDRLQKITKGKETIALKIKIHVQALSSSIKTAAAALGLPVDPMPTLAELAAAAPKQVSGHLEQAGSRLARLKRQISSHNNANHAFVQESLSLVSGSIAILTGAHTRPRQGYLRNGQEAPAAGHQAIRVSKEV